MKVYLLFLIHAHQPKFYLIVTHIKGIFNVSQNLDLGHIFKWARYIHMFCKCTCLFQQWSIPYIFVLLYNLLMNMRFFGYFKGSFFINDSIQTTTVNFLKAFFTLYDSDNRQPLMEAYNEEVWQTFSVFVLIMSMYTMYVWVYKTISTLSFRHCFHCQWPKIPI